MGREPNQKSKTEQSMEPHEAIWALASTNELLSGQERGYILPHDGLQSSSRDHA